MSSANRLIGGMSIVLVPLLFGIGDQLRMAAEPPTGLGSVDPDYGVAEATATLASIDANRGLFLAASYLVLLAVLLSFPAMLAVWRLSVEGAPRWAWVGATLAALGIIGQAVHLAGYFGLSLAFSAFHDLGVAAELFVATGVNSFLIALFVPFLLGLLAPIPQVVGLRRARIIPLWAALAVVAGVAVMVIAGSTPATSAFTAILLAAGLFPAARTMLRTHEPPATTHSVRTVPGPA
ncbi:hypothetical protein [Egicoccus sp. AB-alg2]|uniref:hypothetical protein n=1 Tax=Egicoccus sp. AB-alg2 TaxID=3242693 RepID=UPI00359E8B99